MRLVIVMAAIPAAVWAVSPKLSPPIVAKTVTAENIREQRMDDSTFRTRFAPVADMPPARETVYEPLLLVSHEPVSRTAAGHPVRPPLEKKVALRLDVCARHHMRRVEIRRGRWTGWRCRR
jgi:hypothetical protein